MDGSRSSGRWMAAAFAATTFVALVTLVLGSLLLLRGGTDTLVGAGVVALLLCVAAYTVGFFLDAAAERRHAEMMHRTGEVSHRLDELIIVLRKVREQTMLSDSAKGIVYRKDERKLIQSAFDEELARENWDEASVLIDELIRRFGSGPELNEMRTRVESARLIVAERELDAQIADLEDLMSKFEWEKAYEDAERIANTFADSPRAVQLGHRVDDSRRETGQELADTFRRAAEEDDFDTAMGVLRQLDQHLTEAEAAPLQETARKVIAGYRDVLSDRFKKAVQDRLWEQAIELGEHIVTEFPNSKMAGEVSGLLAGLRGRISGGPAQAGEAQSASPPPAAEDAKSDG